MGTARGRKQKRGCLSFLIVNILNYMNNATTSAKGREELIDQLLYELHRLVFASNDLINRYSSKMGLHGKDGEALLQIWQAELAGAQRLFQLRAHAVAVQGGGTLVVVHGDSLLSI